jgi:hypothetical protein
MKTEALPLALLILHACASNQQVITNPNQPENLQSKIEQLNSIIEIDQVSDSLITCIGPAVTADSMVLVITPWPYEPWPLPYPWPQPYPWPEFYLTPTLVWFNYFSHREPGIDERTVRHSIFNDNCFETEIKENKLIINLEISSETVLNAMVFGRINLTPIKKPNWLLNDMVFKSGKYSFSLKHNSTNSNSVQIKLMSNGEVLLQELRI